MKYCFYSLLWACCALAPSTVVPSALAQAAPGAAKDQSTTAVVIPDLNGRSITTAVYAAKDGERSELSQSVNGRLVPLQKSEAHVVSDGPNGRTSEVVVLKYDGTGRLASTERTVITEEKRSKGAVIHATTYRSDVNGQMQKSELRTIETQASGALATSEVTISRPGVSGSFEVAEKRSITTTTDGASVRETEVVKQPAQSGQLTEVAREIREQTKAGDRETVTATSYEPDFTGKMSLVKQEVATTTNKASNGSSVTQVDIYAPSAYGIARDQNSAPKLREQNVTVRRESNGVVTESTTVSRPTLADPNHLSAPAVASELVCKGKCEGPLQPK